jgi:hypothetical protein
MWSGPPWSPRASSREERRRCPDLDSIAAKPYHSPTEHSLGKVEWRSAKKMRKTEATDPLLVFINFSFFQLCFRLVY